MSHTAQIDGVVYATSTVADGNMSFLYGQHDEVVRNRKRFLSRCGVSLEDTVVMAVTHGDVVREVNEDDRGRGTKDGKTALDAEALITRTRGVVLFLLTADCLPVAFYDPTTATIALAHLGWKPTDHKLCPTLVRALEDRHGVEARNVRVFIGPGIKKDSYIIHNPAQCQKLEWQPFLEEHSTGDTAIDLVGYNTHQLCEAGVIREHISVSPVDTGRNEHHFSHYRAVRSGEPEGRFATIISLPRQ